MPITCNSLYARGTSRLFINQHDIHDISIVVYDFAKMMINRFFAFARFVPSKEANESNMAVMEVSLPSGFTVDRDSLPSLEVSSSHVKRVETRNGDTMVVLYFDKVDLGLKSRLKSPSFIRHLISIPLNPTYYRR